MAAVSLMPSATPISLRRSSVAPATACFTSWRTTGAASARRSRRCAIRADALSASPPRNKYIMEDYLIGLQVGSSMTEALGYGRDLERKKVSAKEVQDLIKGERTVPLIVDFYATWCGPCILMAQELEMLAVEYESNALFVKVDTDDEYEFARDMQVRGLPTLYFISPDPSKDAIRTEGLVPKEMIRNIIDNEL